MAVGVPVAGRARLERPTGAEVAPVIGHRAASRARLLPEVEGVDPHPDVVITEPRCVMVAVGGVKTRPRPRTTTGCDGGAAVREEGVEKVREPPSARAPAEAMELGLEVAETAVTGMGRPPVPVVTREAGVGDVTNTKVPRPRTELPVLPCPASFGATTPVPPVTVVRRVGAIPPGGARGAAPPALDRVVKVAVLADMVGVRVRVSPATQQQLAARPHVAVRPEGGAAPGPATVLVAATALTGGGQALAPRAPVRAVATPRAPTAPPIALEVGVAADPPRMTATATGA